MAPAMMNDYSNRNLRAAIYARISVDPDGTSEAIARQREHCEEHCRRKEWEVVAHFEDRDQSAWGTGAGARRGYGDAREAALAGQYDVLVVTKMDRVVRRASDLAVLLEELESVGVYLTCVDDPIDSSHPSGKMLAQIIGSVAEMESANNSLRRRAANLQRAQSGKYEKSGVRAFGRQLDGTIVESEAEAIRAAVKGVLKGNSLSSEAALLSSKGILTTPGNQFSYQTLGRLLRQPHLRAIRTHRGVEYPGDFEPILDDLSALRVIAVLDKRGKGSRPTTERRHLLTGFAECGLCGTKLQIAGSVKNPRDSSKPRLLRIGCKKSVGGCGRVRASVVGFETEVVARVLDRAVQIDSQRERRAEALRNSPEGIVQLGQRQAELAERLAELEHDFYGERNVTREGYFRSRTTLLEQSEVVRRAIESAQAERRGSALLDSAGPDLSETFSEMPIETRIALVKFVCERIVLLPANRRGGNTFQRDRVQIVWKEIT